MLRGLLARYYSVAGVSAGRMVCSSDRREGWCGCSREVDWEFLGLGGDYFAGQGEWNSSVSYNLDGQTPMSLGGIVRQGCDGTC